MFSQFTKRTLCFYQEIQQPHIAVSIPGTQLVAGWSDQTLIDVLYLPGFLYHIRQSQTREPRRRKRRAEEPEEVEFD